MNSHGLVKEFKSNNSYIVTINEIDKHISSDHMRLSEINSSNDSKDSNNPNVDFNIHIDDTISDTDSVLSDYSDMYVFPNTSNNYQVISNNNNSIPRKKYRTEVEKLNEGFNNLPESRTRSGNRNR